MRLPAVVIAALFACGVVLGQTLWFAHRDFSHAYLLTGFASVAFLIGSGIVLVRIGLLLPAAVFSALSWLILSVLGAGIANQPRTANYVLSLVEAGRADLKTPLRWHGRLRDEPARLPWGYGYEIELTGVEYEGSFVHARGGMRVSFAGSTDRLAAPDVHAGDDLVVTTEAKLPQIYRDEGAFDRRAYLEQQNVDLVATLRAPELMERTVVSPRTGATLLAHVRRRLRDEIDTLFSNRPQVDGVLRAMLLGDRSFVERAESTDFQKTGAFHVLVVADAVACVCGRGGTEAAGASRGIDDGARGDRRIVFPALGFTELRGDGSADFADCKTPGRSRFKLSTDIFGYRLHRWLCRAVVGEKSSAVCEGIARMARRYTRCRARASGGPISDRPARHHALDFLACAFVLGELQRRDARARHRGFASRMRTVGNHLGVANWDAASDGARLSSHYAQRASGQSGRGSDHGDRGAVGLFDARQRTPFARSGEITGTSVGVGDNAAAARCAMVRAVSEMELPDTGATSMADGRVSNG
jgi:hypothetical protein